MKNPMNSKAQGNEALGRDSKLNDPSAKNKLGYRTFDMSYAMPNTVRYGEVSPRLFLDTVIGDRHQIRLPNKIRALKLAAPPYSEIRMHTDTYFVPFASMYPNNHDKIMINPTKGSDVPKEALPSLNVKKLLASFCGQGWNPLAGTSVTLSFQFPELADNLDPLSVTMPTNFNDPVAAPNSPASLYRTIMLMNCAIKLSFILQSDGLLSLSGFSPRGTIVPSKGGTLFQSTQVGQKFTYADVAALFIRRLYDTWLTNTSTLSAGYKRAYLIDLSAPLKPTDSLADVTYKLNFSYNLESYDISTLSHFRHALYRSFEDGDLFAMYSNFLDIQETSETAKPYASINTLVQEFFNHIYFGSSDNPIQAWSPYLSIINPSRILAYQQVLAQFYTSDSVDYAFTSHLMMQNLRAILAGTRGVDDVVTSITVPTFEYNGVQTEYDLMTTGYLDATMGQRYNFYGRLFDFTAVMFGIRHSLKYGDYFSKARPRVLAVGDLSIPVSNSSVNAVDVTKKLVLQRFLNAVNRFGNRPIEYVQGLYGITPTLDEAAPKFIASQTQSVNTQTNVSTQGSSLGKMNANVNTGEQPDNAIDVFIDSEGVILSLVSWSISGCYENYIDRHLLNMDRFEKFNPMLQNVGDQPIYRSEITGDLPQGNADRYPSSLYFGYTTRYGEYKTAFSTLHGGFRRNLPGYVMNLTESMPSVVKDAFVAKITPEFIRDYPLYFDKFYESLTGVAPDDYYHFELGNANEISSNRPMEYYPGIL
ncbi:major capsid protein [Sigmofec virus UA08Rod_3978]|uniref:Major capsid protein n=1 Tax=Sigmofec virus UA08Rod_3978 TaxID=2929392 RepID=A0A976N1W1_9VIRU|nr:major capsid protein [Sigmofec virus UA08Rod_3978]